MSKKIISFSLWGSAKKYNIGAVRNAELAATIYPDWDCWFFCRADVDGAIMIELSQKPNIRVIFVDQPGNWTGMFDRFKAACDPNVDVMISRDCDSRLGEREKAAVDEWLESDKGWHAMRDHPYHSVPILGGTWGVKRMAINPAKFNMMINTWNQQDRLQTDQEFLAKEVWRRYYHDFMVHDDGFYTNHWPCLGNRPFPKPRSGLEFVGQVFDENEITVIEHVNALKAAL